MLKNRILKVHGPTLQKLGGVIASIELHRTCGVPVLLVYIRPRQSGWPGPLVHHHTSGWNHELHSQGRVVYKDIF
jgi:hypothetical protein